MSDDVDDQLRTAMTALDRQVPDGYFDTLAERTLARLDDAARLAAVPPPADDEVEPGAPVAPSAAIAPPPKPAIDELAALRQRRTGRGWIAAAVGAAAVAAGVTVFLSPGGEPAQPEMIGSVPAVSLTPPEPPVSLDPDVPATPRTQVVESLPNGRAGSAQEPGGKPPRVAGGPRDPGPRAPGPDSPARPDEGPGLTPPLGYLPSGSASPGGPSAAEIERSMAQVAPAARSCLAGAPGAVRVRLTVAPSGKVTQVVAQGELAGTPAGACVVRAVSAARFVAWDGEPRQFDYAIAE